MPVVLTDFTNKTWAVEQPNDGYIHVGWLGKSGPRLIEVLEFLDSKQEQFDKFLQKKREEELGVKKNVRRKRHTQVPGSGGIVGSGKE